MRKIFLLLPLLISVLGIVYSLQRTLSVQARPTTGTRGYKVEEIVGGLSVPWSLVFTHRNRILVTERDGQIRIVENNKLLDTPLYRFEEVWSKQEAGLMGLTIDPDYKNNNYIYVSLVYTRDETHLTKVIRLVDRGSEAIVDKILIDDIVAAQYHDGSRIKFGPDGKLYVTTGEATIKNLSQNLKSLNGKILRLNSDGSIPDDNPTKDSAVYSYGHRNPQGIAWDARNRNLWSTEHGPSGIDGPGGGDEINLIKPNGNYGWPLVSHERTKDGTISPLLLFTPAIAPAGAAFYTGDLFPEFKNNLFFGALRGEGIYRLIISDDTPEKIQSFEKLDKVQFGRIRDVIQGPDGAIYFSTSNKDGRGSPRDGDDKIMRLVPAI